MSNIVTCRGRSRMHHSLAALAVALGLGLVGFALGTASGCASEPAPSPSGESRSGGEEAAGARTRIAFLGDSITAGYGVAEDQAFPAVVGLLLEQQGHRVEIVNAGVSGDTSAGGLARVDWVLRSEPDLLVVELGGNDALRGQPLDNIESNLRAIVKRARAAGARVVLVGMDIPTSLGPDYARGFTDLYERVATDLNVTFVPHFIRDIALDRRMMQVDRIHPTPAGHRHLAESLVAPLQSLL